ncbi:MAG: family 20 glycosylhydrolase [Candidatus Lokiarchaeota archaeon]|nr:family 20 glycosylhydrolase [Candidatus Lokiarchaeota archaeon]MBD3202470.1 family 20 glycosylhydrolase [Candidatus Lokiarchaeota archaeon]
MVIMVKKILIKGTTEKGSINREDFVLIPNPKEINYLSDDCFLVLNSKAEFFMDELVSPEKLFNPLQEFLLTISSIELKISEKSDLESLDLDLVNMGDLLAPENKESYNLIIKDSLIIIQGLTEKALFYGIQTLIQLIKNMYISTINLEVISKEDIKDILLPEIEVRDFPDFQMRGVAQDISRGQIFTIDNAKRYINILSHYKMNFYFLYIEDVFSHPEHPKIGKDRGALTCAEIKEIDQFAKEHFITLVPIFECLGHMDNILQHKKYQHLGEFPGAQSLDISNPDIVPFVRDYISKMSECFSTDFFHIGCDESFDVGRYNSKDYLSRVGEDVAIANYYNKMYDICRECDNTSVIMYDDIVRKKDRILKKLNKDMILMYWEYDPNIKSPPVEKFINSGFRVIVSPSMLNWNRPFPDNKNASINITKMIDIGYQYRDKGCLGVINSTWGDQRYFSLRENEIFGAILSADKAWNVLDFDYSNFKQKYGFLFYGIKKNRLSLFNELFTSISSSASLHYRFRLMLPPLFYTDFFKHPFSEENFKPAFKKYGEMRDLGNKCLELYRDLIPNIKFEIKNFEYIQFAAELAKYLGEKLEISTNISDILRKSKITQTKLDSIIKDIIYIRDRVKYMRNKYESLWLHAAKRPCLDYNLRLFDNLIKYYNDKIAQLNNSIYFQNPYLESEWIWVHEKISPIKPRYFRKIVKVGKPVKKALIQVSACNHMKVYVNSEYIGEVIGRLSLSRIPIIKRVRVFDITNYLKEGKNVIGIEAYTYEEYKGAINLFGQIELNDGSIQEVITDKTWLTFKEYQFDSNKWMNIDFKDNNWKHAKSYGPPPNLNGDLIKPDLLSGEISLTQDYFGVSGYFYNGLKLFMSKFVFTILKPFIPFLIRRAKLFG